MALGVRIFTTSGGFFATRGVLSHTADSLAYNFRKAFLPKHLLADQDFGGRPFHWHRLFNQGPI
jgi:hypothetical protein